MPLYAFAFSSTMNLLALTVERYLEVVHPLWHRINITRGMVITCLVSMFLSGPLVYMAYTIPTTRVDPITGQCLAHDAWPDELSKTVRAFSNYLK